MSMYKFAKRLELKMKLAQNAPTVSQSGTTELFFDNETNQRAFNAAIQNPSGSIYKILLDQYNKSKGQECSFDLSMEANPKVGAKWIFNVNPQTLKNSLWVALDKEFKAIVGVGMIEKQKKADVAAKAGSGSRSFKGW